ncbi:MAG: type II toxin-antitoxin system death-on-curing family toxin [Acetobacteraceae bacterium]|nr:type II toxin-antitoxin system death-on-curing family toxin [Acetobacteraceae bacterium]
MEWKWLDPHAVQAVHKSQLARHGGLDGVRDQGLIESALARPLNLASYGDPDAADLAAAYACGIAKNHGFLDGNKRTAWVSARTFLAVNGFDIRFNQIEGFFFMQSVADGTMNEAAAADWFRSRIVR